MRHLFLQLHHSFRPDARLHYRVHFQLFFPVASQQLRCPAFRRLMTQIEICLPALPSGS